MSLPTYKMLLSSRNYLDIYLVHWHNANWVHKWMGDRVRHCIGRALYRNQHLVFSWIYSPHTRTHARVHILDHTNDYLFFSYKWAYEHWTRYLKLNVETFGFVFFPVSPHKSTKASHFNCFSMIQLWNNNPIEGTQSLCSLFDLIFCLCRHASALAKCAKS